MFDTKTDKHKKTCRNNRNKPTTKIILVAPPHSIVLLFFFGTRGPPRLDTHRSTKHNTINMKFKRHVLQNNTRTNDTEPFKTAGKKQKFSPHIDLFFFFQGAMYRTIKIFSISLDQLYISTRTHTNKKIDSDDLPMFLRFAVLAMQSDCRHQNVAKQQRLNGGRLQCEY
jgi:hypothetical protein